MGGPFETELDGDELIALVRVLGRELAAARGENTRLRKRIEEIEGRSPTTRLDESYSLQAEERRREKCRQKSSQRGRRKTQNKLDQAQRTEVVCPEGFSVDECKLYRERPVWRVENGGGAGEPSGKDRLPPLRQVANLILDSRPLPFMPPPCRGCAIRSLSSKPESLRVVCQMRVLLFSLRPVNTCAA